MVKKPNGGYPLNLFKLNEDKTIAIDTNNSSLKPWDYTCKFCHKKFQSGQSLGGHQNAHRNQRMAQKRLNVRNKIANRSRAYLRAIKSLKSGPYLHALKKMVKNEFKLVKRVTPKPVILQGVINFFPPKELSLAESVGVYANDVKEKPGLIVGGYGVNSAINLDLALKL